VLRPFDLALKDRDDFGDVLAGFWKLRQGRSTCEELSQPLRNIYFYLRFPRTVRV
jgi:hypothetical protein